MRCTWLPQVLRDAGLKVAVQPGADGRGRDFAATPKGVIAHHTAGPATGEAPSLRIVTEGRSDLPGPLSQLVLGRSGTFYYVAAGRANHAGRGAWQGVTTGNASLIGIEAEATGRDAWPAAQMDAYRRGVAAILRRLGRDANWVCGHKEYALPRGRKPDPNFDMVAFRRDVQRILNGGPRTASTFTPTAATPPPGGFLMALSDDEQKELLATVRTLKGEVDRLTALAPRFVLDKGHPRGAVYVIDAAGTSRRWVSSNPRLDTLRAVYPARFEEWAAEDVADVPLIGPPPPAA